MGILKKIGKSIGNAINNKIKNETKNISGLISNPMETVGKLINDVTGVTSSARQQIEAQKDLQTMAQNYNAEQAQIERDWQTEMSNTARQRAIEDSEKAGVNPILAAGGTAAGASAGAGAAATSSPGQAGTGVGQNPISMLTELIKASNNTAKTQAEIKNINADTSLKNQQEKNGGTGGTGFTRTIDWLGKKTDNLSARMAQRAKEMKNKSIWSKEFWNQ